MICIYIVYPVSERKNIQMVWMSYLYISKSPSYLEISWRSHPPPPRNIPTSQDEVEDGHFDHVESPEDQDDTELYEGRPLVRFRQDNPTTSEKGEELRGEEWEFTH